jgi:hypothetical protein
MIKKAEWLSISHDRTMVIMLITVVLATIAVVISSVLRIHFSDVQIPSRYSVFGTANIYRSHWYALYMFPLFAVLVALTNGYLAVKAHNINRMISVGALGISLIVMIICLAVAHAVFNLAPTV